VGVTTAASRSGRAALLAVLASVLAAALTTGSAAAATTRAKGLDVSHWNGAIDWIRVAGSGYKFIFGKVTEGVSLIDPTYSINRAGTEGLGMRFGAYHFARPAGASDAAATASAIQQADFFVDTAQPEPGELPPVLDLEVTGGLQAARLQVWTRAWLDEVAARLGVQPLIYSSPNFWKGALGDSSLFASAGNKLWVAHWTKNTAPLVPAANWAGLGWTFWQWTDCSTVPGFAHCSDGDRMNGPNPSSVAIAPYPTDVPVVSTPPHVVGGAVAGVALAAVPGVWSGGKPVGFTYQWQRCDAAGANCNPITGAITSRYVPGTADVGHSLVVSVAATTTSGQATATAPPTAAVAAAGTKPSVRPAALSEPQVSGTAQAGQVLTAQVGTWSGAPTSFAYQWRRCDTTGVTCVAIVAATGTTYTVTPGDIGSTLSLLVTATGKGGSTAVSTGATGTVAAAPVPAAVPGSLTAEPGLAGAVVTTDGRATVTWQPGAIPVGLTAVLAPFTGTLSISGSEVALGVANLGLSGFPWPVDIGYASPQAARTVLGYSTDSTIYAAVPALTGPALPAKNSIGSYVAPDGTLHVLTRVPARLALFQKGAWGDPSLSSVHGPNLVRHSPVHVVRRPDGSVLVLTSLSSASQVELSAGVLDAHHGRLGIFGKGSRLGPWLKAGRSSKSVQAQILRPGGIPVRLRVNGRFVAHGGHYRLRLVAADPWGRTATLVLPFTAP
jgi:GH25 family lysozyme M1 (1,4-beta-N-acetylmuramidase)